MFFAYASGEEITPAFPSVCFRILLAARYLLAFFFLVAWGAPAAIAGSSRRPNEPAPAVTKVERRAGGWD